MKKRTKDKKLDDIFSFAEQMFSENGGSLLPIISVGVDWAKKEKNEKQKNVRLNIVLSSSEAIENRALVVQNLGSAFKLINMLGIAGEVNSVMLTAEAWMNTSKDEESMVKPSWIKMGIQGRK